MIIIMIIPVMKMVLIMIMISKPSPGFKLLICNVVDAIFKY